MAKWTNISTGFDLSNETVNFGTRAVAFTNEGVYESCTVATLKPDEKEGLKDYPNCSGIFSYKPGILVASDKSIILFEHGFCKVLLSVNFETSIDRIELSSNGDLMFCGLCDGTFVCLSVSNEGKLLFSKSISVKEAKQCSNFARIISKCTDRVFEVYAFLKNGTVLKAYHEDIEKLLELAVNKDDVSDVISFSINTPKTLSYSNLYVSELLTYEGEDVFMRVDDYSFSLCTCDFNILINIFEENSFSIREIKYAHESKQFVALCDDGYLLILCAYTLQIVQKWYWEKVKAFTILDTGGKTENNTTDMVIITDSHQPEICVVELPVLEVKMRLKVGQHAYLIEKQTIHEEGYLYIEGFEEDSIVNALSVKAINESSPEYRFERLLYRCKFNEAEQFAKTMGLSLEEVYEAKVKWLMDKLAPNKNPALCQEYFTELQNLLEKIENVEFVAECCLKVIIPDLNMIKRLINYASSRLHRSTKTDGILSLMDQITKLNITLGTYIQINEDSNSPESWIIFSQSNPIAICRNFLLRGDIQKAVVVCRRHQGRIIRELPTGVAEELFLKIPLSLSVEEVLQWLKAYLPVLIAAHSALLPCVIDWVIERIKSLELEVKSVWLEQGLKFVNEVLEVLRSLPVKDGSLVGTESNSPLRPLHTLARQLTLLSTLKDNYFITMDFDEYLLATNMQKGAVELITLVLSRIGLGKLHEFIPMFFSSFCVQHHLDKDLVLSLYVKDMVKQQSTMWAIESPWECRAIAFIRFIQSVQHKMEAIEIAIQNVVVPWSTEMKALAEESIKIDHPIANNIYEQMKKVPVKLILKKYGLPMIDNFEVRGLMMHIFKENQEDMMDDAKKLVEFGDINELLLPYFIYLFHMIGLGEIENGLTFIKSELDKDQLIKVTQQAISCLLTLLQMRYIKPEEECFNAIPILRSMLMALNPKAATDLEEDIQNLFSFRTLKVKYKIELTLSLLHKPIEARKHFLRQHLAKLIGSYDSSLNKLADDAGEIAILLNLPRESGLMELSTLYVEKPVICVHFLKLLVESDDTFLMSHSGRLLDLISSFLNVITLHGLKMENELWETISCLLKKVFIYAGTRYLTRCSELILLVRLCSTQKTGPPDSIYKQFYFEQNEAPLVTPPISFCNRVIKGTSESSVEENSKLHKDMEVSLRSMPCSLSSLNRSQNMLWVLHSHGDLIDFEKSSKILAEKVFSLLSRVIYSRNLDLELALGLLSLVPVESGIRWLQTHTSTRRENWSNLKNASAVALVGKHYVTLTNPWNQWDLPRGFAENYLKFECFRTLQRFGLAPKVADTLCETHSGKRTLLLKLMASPEVDVKCLHKICRDLHFDFQECLRLYWEHTLLTWEARFKETVNPKTGKTELIMLSSKEELAHKCSQIEALTTMKQELVEYLKKKILPCVNFYNYEVFMVIIDTIINLSPGHTEVFTPSLLLLTFLESYRRIGPVSREETDSWFHYFPDLSILPLISKYRLPFAPLPKDPWKIIKPELTLQTYKLWLESPMWLGESLDKDIICSLTIMNLKGEVTNSPEWNLHFQHQAFMAEIAECISRIQNMETAVAASYCVVNHIMPPGADKVEAAQRCFLKAQEWVSREYSESAKIGRIKAEKKYVTVSTYHSLYKYQLAKPEYLALSSLPIDLITALYHDPSILTRDKDFSSAHPEINKAVARIASYHNIPLFSVFKELLTEWLQPMSSSMNSSFMENDPISSSYVPSDNIVRACYLLTGFKEMQNLMDFLLSIVFGQESQIKSATVRFQALQCLRATNTEKQLRELTGRELDLIKELMRSLEFISDLEKFGLDYTVLEFDHCPKEEIVETLLKQSFPSAIALATKMSVNYQVWSPTIWNLLLSNMTSFSMLKMLEYCLPEVNEIVNRLDETILKEAWECLIFNSLSQIRYSDDSQKEIEKNFSLIQSCPVINILDLKKIIAMYTELKFSSYAEILAKFVDLSL